MAQDGALGSICALTRRPLKSRITVNLICPRRVTTSLRTGRSPHPCALCLLPADVGSVLGRSVPLPTAVVVRPGRQIEPNHDVGVVFVKFSNLVMVPGDRVVNLLCQSR